MREYKFRLVCCINSFRSTDPKDERPLKKILIKYQSSPPKTTKIPVVTYPNKGKKLMFEDEVVRQLSDEVSQKTSSVAGGSDQLDRDLTGHKWALQYIDSKKNLVVLVTRLEGRGMLAQDRPFNYGKNLRLDYKDAYSNNLIVLVGCTKGVRKMIVSEDYLLKDSCRPECFRNVVETSTNLITTLRPYIEGHVTLKQASLSPILLKH